SRAGRTSHPQRALPSDARAWVSVAGYHIARGGAVRAPRCDKTPPSHRRVADLERYQEVVLPRGLLRRPAWAYSRSGEDERLGRNDVDRYVQIRRSDEKRIGIPLQPLPLPHARQA